MQRLTITTAKKIAETNIDAMKYPESPRFSMTAASATHASEPPPHAKANKIRAANLRPWDSKSAVPRFPSPRRPSARQSIVWQIAGIQTIIRELKTRPLGKCGESHKPRLLYITACADCESYSTQLANFLFSCLGVGRAWFAGFGATGSAACKCHSAVTLSARTPSVTPHACVSTNQIPHQMPTSMRDLVAVSTPIAMIKIR